MLLAPVRKQLQRTAPSPFSLMVEPGQHPAVFSTSDQHQHVVIRTGAFDLIEASPEKRGRFVSLFEDLLSALDVRIQLHVASRLSSGETCADSRLARYLGERALTNPSYERSVHLVLSDTPPQIDRLAARWHRMRGNVVATTPDAAIAEALLRQADGAISQLRGMGLHPLLLEGMALHRFLDLQVPHPLTRPEVAYDWSESPDELDLDGVLHRTYLLNGYPGAELLPGWLGPLLDLPAEFDLSVHAFKVTPASAMRMLNTRIRDLQATRMSDAATGSIGDPLAEAGLPEAIGLRREIAANQQHAFSVAVYLGLSAGSLAQLQAVASRTEDAGARCMAQLLPAKFQMAPGRLCTSPIGVDPVSADRLLPSGVLGTLCPWVWDEIRQPGGRLFGFSLRGGSPVLVDTFDEDRFSNANIGIFGHSGAGKTYLMKSLLLADAEQGMGAFIIDPEDEYREVCRRAGGQWIDLALGSANSINVLDPALGSVGERDPLGDQVIDLLDLVATMCGSLGDDDRADVDEALHTVLQSGDGTLADVRSCLEQRARAPRVVKALRRWTEGPIGALFSRPTNVKVDADFVAFGLRDLKEEMLPVVYFLIAQWIWARVRSSPRPRRVLFDEVGLLFEYPLVRRFLVRLARRLRKYQGSLCLVTQNAGDLLGSDQGLVLATNPSTLVLGAQRHAEALRLQRAYGLTDGQTDFLANARRGEFLLLAGDTRHRLKVAAPPWFDEVLGFPGPSETHPSPRL
ncbi:MAG TPA: DUF87 domain-containing protein [Candidatus Solibacter sp.]|jgi:hypothetical protein|nr:DUF87 domain-containing protein [Candidatus Solibacter sp.]